eukprot:3256685-Alexandrium_andersonii.AAC.1
MSASLVGSEMCIRDSPHTVEQERPQGRNRPTGEASRMEPGVEAGEEGGGGKVADSGRQVGGLLHGAHAQRRQGQREGAH